MKRRKARKLGIPDWVGDDEDLGVGIQNSDTDTDSDSSPSSSAVLAEVDEAKHSNILRANKPKPNYEYLLGNKHARKMMSKPGQYGGLPSPNFSKDAVAMAMPLISFNGSIVYSYDAGDCSIICDEIIESYLNEGEKELHVGFDLEWPVTYSKGAGVGKVALIQVSVDESKCYLFHLSTMTKFPESLKTLLEHDNLRKVGVNIESDIWKLTRDFDFDGRRVIRTSIIDLGKLANKLLKSSGVWSLDGLCRNVLRMRMNKDETVRCGQWDEFPLDDQQKMYAATDAYVSLRIYNTLVESNKLLK